MSTISTAKYCQRTREPGLPDILFRSREELLPGLDKYRSVLSREEQARSARYAHPERKLQFILGRGLLREVLGQYTGVSPRDLQLGVLAGGKPFAAQRRISFNLSHSGGMYMIGLMDTGPVGVDLQQNYPIASPGRLARRYFSDAENQQLIGLSEVRFREEFFKCWVRKEAYLKGLGTGFRRRPEEISILPAGIPGQYRVEDPHRTNLDQAWIVVSLRAPEGYCAAAAFPVQDKNRTP